MNQPRLLDRVRSEIQTRQYSYRTEQAYIFWIKRFIRFHRLRHPAEMGGEEVAAFLSHLAVERRVSAATQNQALNALLFLYRAVLGRDLPWMSGVVRARRPERVPVVYSPREVRALLAHLQGVHWLMASLLYGAGLRLRECPRLRVKDVDLHYREITVRDGKGRKDRVTVLPDSVRAALGRQLAHVEAVHAQDLRERFSGASLPYALARKYPNAPRELAWQYVFPSLRMCCSVAVGV